MKRKSKIEIVRGLEDAYDSLALSIKNLNEAKAGVGELPHALTLIGEDLATIKNTFFNKGKSQ